MSNLFKSQAFSDEFPFKAGETIFFRGVTMYYIGTIDSVSEKFIRLAPGAVWVIDMGELDKCLSTGEVPLCQGYPHGVTIPVGTMVDCTLWNHSVPSGSNRR